MNVVLESTAIAHILQTYRTVAMVGLSPKSHRDSFIVARYMQAQGWRIIPVNPLAQVPTILGEKVYASLTDAAQQERIELVNVFRNSADVPPIAQEAMATGAKALWLQLGVAHAEACAQAASAGLYVVQNKCLKIEHAHRVNS